MNSVRVSINGIKNFDRLDFEIKFCDSKILVITGRNGAGKTSIVKSFGLISDPAIFNKSSGFDAVRKGSSICFNVDGYSDFTFKYNEKISGLDTRDSIPDKKEIVAELPLPFGARFQRFSLISNYDSEIRTNIAASMYESAEDLIGFLRAVYPDSDFSNLMKTNIKNNVFYFILRDQDYYVREDHFSSGEFFLIQLYRIISSGAKFIIIDELDVALDASAQVRVYSAIEDLISGFQTKLIVVSHSLAFMETAREGSLYYLEKKKSDPVLENRSFGYIKSDLYGFKGRDRYILVEDEVLVKLIRYLIGKHVESFFEYEIIAVGGKPQVEAISNKNDDSEIFGPPASVMIVVDKDIYGSLKYNGMSEVLSSPVDDVEVFVWRNKEKLPEDINVGPFNHARKEKDTAKTFFKKITSKDSRAYDATFSLLENEYPEETNFLIERLKAHLCL